MTESFNLVDQAFIPVLTLTGEYQRLGLSDTLNRAHLLAEIRHSSPVVTLCLHRLLLAILWRVYAPCSFDAWRRIWSKGSFDKKLINQYFERWRDRFDLLHPERPFYQTGRSLPLDS